MTVQTPTPWMAALGRNITKHRKAADMSQAVLARHCGTRTSEISVYENGTQTPNIARLRPMADALGVTVDDLLP